VLQALLTAAVLVGGTVAVTSCGGGALAQGTSLPATPKAFFFDSSAELATDGQRGLWLVMAGYNRHGGDFGAKVFQEQSSGWKMLPSIPQGVSSDGQINIAIENAATTAKTFPCLAFSERSTRKPVITCWAGRSWQLQHFANLIPHSAQLVQLANVGRQLVALFETRPSPKATRFDVLRQSARGWEAAGSSIRMSGALAQLGKAASSSPDLTIGFETQGLTPSRYVLSLTGKHWAQQGPAFKGPGLGPLVSGPVTFAMSTYFPVIDAEAVPWSFSVFALHRGSTWHRAAAEPLSKGSGNAQGRIDFAGNTVWASWQQDKEAGGGRFRAQIYAAELNENGAKRRKIRLWQGTSIGPGNTQVVKFRGNLLALYMRSVPGSHGSLRTMVQILPGS
jgi:hypothetical protein